MIQPLNPRLSRLLAWTLLLAVMALFWTAGVQPLRGAFDGARERAERSSLLLAQYRRIAEGRGDIQARVEEARTRGRNADGYLTAAAAPLAAADLQKVIKDTVARSGGNLRSLQTLPSQPEGAFERITVRLQMDGDLATLERCLRGLETATAPVLLLSEVDLHGVGAQSERLEFQADVTGFRRESPK